MARNNDAAALPLRVFVHIVPAAGLTLPAFPL